MLVCKLVFCVRKEQYTCLGQEGFNEEILVWCFRIIGGAAGVFLRAVGEQREHA